jgi:hypothetical protein
MFKVSGFRLCNSISIVFAILFNLAATSFSLTTMQLTLISLKIKIINVKSGEQHKERIPLKYSHMAEIELCRWKPFSLISYTQQDANTQD